MIRFENQENFIELNLAKQETENLPSKGDAYITIKLNSNGYAGQNKLWVSYQSLCNFCDSLIFLEKKRKGEATLKSLSPEELRLQIFSIDSLGHMGVRGSTGFKVFKETDLFPHSVTFGFEFDPSQLSKAVQAEWIKINAAEKDI